MIKGINCFKEISSLIINEDVYNAVRKEILSNRGARIPQSIMIIGQEGSGKTTLLKRLYLAFPDRKPIWIDGREVFSTSNIVEKSTWGQDSLLFIDNVDFFFNRCSYEEQYRLRRVLYNEGGPMMIASLSKVMPAIAEYEAPFFEGLKNIYIPPLKLEEILKEDVGFKTARIQNLYALLPPTIHSLMTVAGIMSLNSNPQIDLELLIGIFTNKYKNLYESQPTYSQHLLNALSTERAGLTLPAIRNLTNLSSGTISAYLKSLAKYALISTDSSVKKHTIYSISDPLFFLWLQPERGKGI